MKVVITPVKRWRVSFLLISLLIGSALQAGQFGKIKGTVTDIETGEPLSDANVVVLGTVPLRGASTDLEGEFMISQVLPGEYDLECRMLGYKVVVMQGVLVNVDHTTTGIELQLPSTESKLEDVVVQAKRAKIQIDQVSSTVSISAQDLERSAVVDIGQVIQSKPGFKTDQEGALHARGAREGQVAITINGIVRAALSLPPGRELATRSSVVSVTRSGAARRADSAGGAPPSSGQTPLGPPGAANR